MNVKFIFLKGKKLRIEKTKTEETHSQSDLEKGVIKKWGTFDEQFY